MQAMIWPTTPEKGIQSILSHWNVRDNSGFILGIDSNGAASFRIGDGSGKVQEVSTGVPLIAREWYFVAASFDAKSGAARVLQDPKVDYAKCNDRADGAATFSGKVCNNDDPILIAACYVENVGSRIRAAEYYN